MLGSCSSSPYNQTYNNKEDLSNIVSWMPHGRAFIVKSIPLFVEKIMPRYFKQSKWTSFQRQLNLYGFQRLTKGADAGAYYHEYFLRGKIFLCSKIYRTKIKGTKCKGANKPDTEPDFYAMASVSSSVEGNDFVIKKEEEELLLGSGLASDNNAMTSRSNNPRTAVVARPRRSSRASASSITAKVVSNPTSPSLSTKNLYADISCASGKSTYSLPTTTTTADNNILEIGSTNATTTLSSSMPSITHWSHYKGVDSEQHSVMMNTSMPPPPPVIATSTSPAISSSSSSSTGSDYWTQFAQEVLTTAKGGIACNYESSSNTQQLAPSCIIDPLLEFELWYPPVSGPTVAL